MLEQPQLVAFGTVAELAAAAGAGAATVVRLATKLGFDGFTELQSSVQHDLANQLRPAAQRIREPVGTDLVGRHLQLEQANVVPWSHQVWRMFCNDAAPTEITGRRVV